MNTYKISIEVLSPLETPLKGDTIWGHIAWGIANHQGDEAVAEFIEDCKNPDKAFVVSSAFPKGTICKNIEPPPERKDDFDAEDYAKIKQCKKQKFQSAAYFVNEVPTSKSDKESEEKLKNPFAQNISTHNSINRWTNTVQEGALYATSEMWSRQKDFDIYLVSSYSEKRIEELFEWAFENGYGADSSVGKGKISVAKNSLHKVTFKKNGSGIKKYVALSPFVLTTVDSDELKAMDLRADIFVRSGKIGGAFVSSHIPWKKTVVMYDEGATFISDKEISFIGNLITDVHQDPKICQAGFAPVIPIE